MPAESILECNQSFGGPILGNYHLKHRNYHNSYFLVSSPATHPNSNSADICFELTR